MAMYAIKNRNESKFLSICNLYFIEYKIKSTYFNSYLYFFFTHCTWKVTICIHENNVAKTHSHKVKQVKRKSYMHRNNLYNKTIKHWDREMICPAHFWQSNNKLESHGETSKIRKEQKFTKKTPKIKLNYIFNFRALWIIFIFDWILS